MSCDSAPCDTGSTLSPQCDSAGDCWGFWHGSMQHHTPHIQTYTCYLFLEVHYHVFFVVYQRAISDLQAWQKTLLKLWSLPHSLLHKALSDCKIQGVYKIIQSSNYHPWCNTYLNHIGICKIKKEFRYKWKITSLTQVKCIPFMNTIHLFCFHIFHKMINIKNIAKFQKYIKPGKSNLSNICRSHHSSILWTFLRCLLRSYFLLRTVWHIRHMGWILWVCTWQLREARNLYWQPQIGHAYTCLPVSCDMCTTQLLYFGGGRAWLQEITSANSTENMQVLNCLLIY